mgnify:CR=1 FL=1
MRESRINPATKHPVPDQGREENGASAPEKIATGNTINENSGRQLAPCLAGVADDELRRRAFAGEAPKDIARLLGRREAEIVLRLVQLEVGPLGRVRPAGRDGHARLSERTVTRRRPQPPVTSLAAQALGDGIQRLGDRLFLRGRAIELPALVRLAGEKGGRIRYPGIDPVDSAFDSGPSIRPRRRRRHALFGGRSI